MEKAKSGKMQHFVETKEGYTATLRKLDAEKLYKGVFRYVLRIRDYSGLVLYVSGFNTARAAKEELETMSPFLSWFTASGLVIDEEEAR